MTNNEYPYPFGQYLDHTRRPYYNDETDYNTNSPSYYEDLARKQGLLEVLSDRIWQYDKILADKLKELDKTMTRYQEIIDGKVRDFDSIIIEKTEKWLNENMEDIITQAVQLVWFGLSDDGYFMAVIPKNWSDVNFDTTNEGQLMLIN